MFNDFIIKKLKNIGASLVGFADLSILPDTARCSFRYGISIGISLNKSIVSQIPSGPHMDYYHEYISVNNKLNELCEYTADLIKSKGFDAFPQSKKHIKQDSNWRTPLPHKTVATLAGIGWIGKSAVLVNNYYGSAIRITSVLTNMPFVVGNAVSNSACGECNICVCKCPGKAIKGKIWDTHSDRNELMNPDLCKKTVIQRGKKFDLTEATCGICIAVCPYTIRYLNENAV